MLLFDLRPFYKFTILFAESKTIFSFRLTSKMSASIPKDILEASSNIKETLIIPDSSSLLMI
jgi:hypothetical protein